MIPVVYTTLIRSSFTGSPNHPVTGSEIPPSIAWPAYWFNQEWMERDTDWNRKGGRLLVMPFLGFLIKFSLTVFCSLLSTKYMETDFVQQRHGDWLSVLISTFSPVKTFGSWPLANLQRIKKSSCLWTKGKFVNNDVLVTWLSDGGSRWRVALLCSLCQFSCYKIIPPQISNYQFNNQLTKFLNIWQSALESQCWILMSCLFFFSWETTLYQQEALLRESQAHQTHNQFFSPWSL